MPNLQSATAPNPETAPVLDPHFDPLAALLCTVHDLSLRLRRRYNAREGFEQGSVAASHVLRLLEASGPLTVPQIARWRSTSRQNIQVLANRLKEEGSIEFVANPSHHRSPLLRLTEEGRGLREKTEAKERDELQDLRQRILPSEAAIGLKVLRQISDLLDRKPGELQTGAGEKEAGPSKPVLKRRPTNRGPSSLNRSQADGAEDTINGATDLPVSLL